MITFTSATAQASCTFEGLDTKTPSLEAVGAALGWEAIACTSCA